MLAREIINTSILPLDIKDTGITALSRMDEFRIDHLPVLCEGEYLNIITEENIFQSNIPDQPLDQYNFAARLPAVNPGQHLIDVMRMLTVYNLSLVAVVNEKNQYLGCITRSDIINALARLDIIQSPGGIIVLEVNLRDYNLTEIAQIIESADGKVLGLYTTTHTDSNILNITIKVNLIDLSAMLTTFNRYNYIIKASFGQSDLDDLLRDRYDALMNYLNL